MKTDALEVARVLQDNRRLTVPIYQRQYAWRSDRLDPFWEDLVSKAEELLESTVPKFQHYMGALILAPGADGYSVGRVSSVQVVDGQQRLTTFYLFLAALRVIATCKENDAIKGALDFYLFSDERSAPAGATLQDRLKLLPTPADRAIFTDLMTLSPEDFRRRHPVYYYKNGNFNRSSAPRALVAFEYFCARIQYYADWGQTELNLDSQAETALTETAPYPLSSSRLQALADAMLLQFKLVVITLEEGDDAQVIFETLNSRGEPLLAMDLVRNNIFHRAETQGEAAERLFETRWKPYDASFWKEDAPRAKPKRPRIDHFLSHALTAQTGQETSLRELYAEYRAFARPQGRARFESVDDELNALLRFNPVYESLENGSGNADLAWLGQKLSIWEVASVYPLVFATAVAKMDDEEKRTIYRLIYSYIVRRAICGLTAKNLNKNFTRIVALFRTHGPSLATFRSSFAEQSGPTVRFPSNNELTDAIFTLPIYEHILRADRLMDILWELEKNIRTKFQADEQRPELLSIEHVLPQSWAKNWPLPDGRTAPEDETGVDEEMTTAIRHRNSRRHRLGNLTLVTTSLNSSLRNQGFDHKRQRLGESLLAINTEIAKSPAWNESSIDSRGRFLAELAINIWPAL